MGTRRFWLYAGLAAALVCSTPASAQPTDVPNVLILQSLDTQTYPYLAISQAFRSRFQQHYDQPVSIAEISLDVRWGGTKDREPFQVELIRNRIASQRPDLVLNIGPSAIDFWQRNRQAIAPDIPSIMAARQSYRNVTTLEPGDAGLFSEWSIPKVVDQILELLPDTKEMVIVFGASELERAQTEEARRDLAGYASRIRFHFTSDLTIAGVEDLVAHLPPNAAVLLGIFSIDAQGVTLPLHTGAERLVAASDVPVFSAFYDELGLGVVGGRLIQLQNFGAEIAATAEQMLEHPVTQPIVRVIPLSRPTYDWRALRRWHIDVAHLPPESEVLFHEPSLWEKYDRWILFIGAVLALQSVTIAALLIHRRRLRIAEVTGMQLSRRLITAHEDERSRIARELHDDLSQRLAGLAIDSAMLSSDREMPDRSEVLRNMHAELVRLGRDVHDMSYQLHPSIVAELGLVTALRTEMDRVRRLYRLRIDDGIEALAEAPRADVALCLYRITQESLTNAAMHAEAAVISVHLRQDHNSYVLQVQDDGKGFDVRQLQRTSGIGVSGMRERAHLVGGKIRVRSVPGKGTRIVAKVPVGEIY